jgi:hypothetical protein
MLVAVFVAAALSILASASPIKGKGGGYYKYFDLQGHRGGRGQTIEKYIMLRVVSNNNLIIASPAPSLRSHGA